MLENEGPMEIMSKSVNRGSGIVLLSSLSLEDFT
jgi:hypothetical protein